MSFLANLIWFELAGIIEVEVKQHNQSICKNLSTLCFVWKLCTPKIMYHVFFCRVKWTSITGIIPHGQQATIDVNETRSRGNICQHRLSKPCPESILFYDSSSSLSGGLCLLLLCYFHYWKNKDESVCVSHRPYHIFSLQRTNLRKGSKLT